MKLVVVESPNKIKKIKSYLGSDYDVVATVGHFCDKNARSRHNGVADSSRRFSVPLVRLRFSTSSLLVQQASDALIDGGCDEISGGRVAEQNKKDKVFSW